MNTETTKKWLFLFSSSLLGVIPLILLATKQTSEYVETAYAKRSIPYSCASYHFGMNDDTLRANTYTSISTQRGFGNNPYYQMDALPLTSCTLSSVYFEEQENYAIRVGSNTKTGTIKFVLNTPIVQITCYCFAPSETELKINGVSQIVSASSGLKNYVVCNLLYKPYSFILNSKTSITITANNVYIADITFRVY